MNNMHAASIPAAASTFGSYAPIGFAAKNRPMASFLYLFLYFLFFAEPFVFSFRQKERGTMELPLVPIEVVVEFVLPHAFDSFAQALELMLLCSDVYEFATSRCAFWEPFLWRRLDEVVIPRLQAAYHRYAPTLIHLLRTYALYYFRRVRFCECSKRRTHDRTRRTQHTHHRKYVMWPKSIMGDETLDVMQAVRSKVFVVEQVPDRWGDLHPVCCKNCRMITTTPWCVSHSRAMTRHS